MQSLLPTQPGTYKQVIARSFALYKASLPHVILLSVLLSLIVFLPRFLSLVTNENLLSTDFLSLERLWMFALELIAIILFISIVWGVYSFAQHRHEPIAEDVVMGMKKAISVFIAAFIQAIAVLAVAFSIYGLQFAMASRQVLFLDHPISIVLACLVFAGQLLLMVYVYTLFIFLVPLITIEHRGILGSLRHSVYLVWNHWWRTFSVQATPWLAYLLLLMLLRFVLRLKLHIYFVESNPTLAMTMLHVFIFAPFIPWSAATLLVQLKDLELRKKLSG